MISGKCIWKMQGEISAHQMVSKSQIKRGALGNESIDFGIAL